MSPLHGIQKQLQLVGFLLRGGVVMSCPDAWVARAPSTLAIFI